MRNLFLALVFVFLGSVSFAVTPSKIVGESYSLEFELSSGCQFAYYSAYFAARRNGASESAAQAAGRFARANCEAQLECNC